LSASNCADVRGKAAHGVFVGEQHMSAADRGQQMFGLGGDVETGQRVAVRRLAQADDVLIGNQRLTTRRRQGVVEQAADRHCRSLRADPGTRRGRSRQQPSPQSLHSLLSCRWIAGPALPTGAPLLGRPNSSKRNSAGDRIVAGDFVGNNLHMRAETPQWISSQI
jgi:hypothetical protein